MTAHLPLFWNLSADNFYYWYMVTALRFPPPFEGGKFIRFYRKTCVGV